MAQTSEALENFRAEAKSWLAENFPPSLAGQAGAVLRTESVDRSNPDLDVWIQRLGEKGWGTPTWPAEYGGGGLSQLEAQVLNQEIDAIGAFNPLIVTAGMGITMVGPTILEYGTEEQKKRHIPKICLGTTFWSLGYSEPNAGSDLASLQCRAEDMGDHWRLNGQKTWTSGADVSDWCGVLCRTDMDAPKRDGISFIMIDMNQSEIETRPIRLIAGASPFCETFFNNARAEKDDLLGDLNAGWTVGKRLLQHERQMISGIGGNSAAGGTGTRLEDVAKDYIGVENGKISDPFVRTDVTNHRMNDKAFQLTMARAGEEAKAGSPDGNLASIFKYYGTEQNKRKYERMLEMMGTQSVGWTGTTFSEKEIGTTRQWLRSKANSIEGGTSEVQLNVISKRVLGLPD